MLVSGFFSALSSFLKDMEDYGEMRTLATSTGTRFTFYQAESLLFVACTDGSLPEGMVDRILRRTCMSFMSSYGKHLQGATTINAKMYTGFNQVLEREVLSRELRSHDPAGRAPVHASTPVPRLLVARDRLRREFGFSGTLHDTVIQHIDGSTDVSAIARLANLDEGKIHAALRYLVKQGVVQM